ncbi:MAG: hypothetical protein PWR12_2069 [Eubacteriaceae bacterium]|jgi:hypothetical protein|nr:hypothetical protein [Eubacteriaceae bacterium]
MRNRCFAYEEYLEIIKFKNLIGNTLREGIEKSAELFRQLDLTFQKRQFW